MSEPTYLKKRIVNSIPVSTDETGLTHLAWAIGTAFTTSEKTTRIASGARYACIVDHTATAADEPGVGANFETYWQLIAEPWSEYIVWDGVSSTHEEYFSYGNTTPPTVSQGLIGSDGWSPVLTGVVDNDRRVLQVTDWIGGSGTKPAVGSYIGVTGLVANIVDALDVRGAPGSNGINADAFVFFAALKNYTNLEGYNSGLWFLGPDNAASLIHDTIPSSTIAGNCDDVLPDVRNDTTFKIDGAGKLLPVLANVHAMHKSVSTGALLGIHVQPARTNLVDRSYNFTESTWAKTELTISAGAEGPLPGINWNNCVPTAVNSQHTISNAQTTVNGQEYVDFIIAKSNGHDFIRMTTSNSAQLKINLATGLVEVHSGTINDFGSVDLGDGVWLIWARCTETSTSAPVVIWFLETYGGNTVWTGNGTDGALIACFDLQQGFGPTMPILNPDATQNTRDGDVISHDDTELDISEAFGTVSVLIDQSLWDIEPGGVLFSIYNSASPTNDNIILKEDSGNWKLDVTVGGVVVGTQTGPAIASLAGASFSYDRDAASLLWSVDGLTQTAVSPSSFPPGLNKVNWCSSPSGDKQPNLILRSGGYLPVLSNQTKLNEIST